MGDQTGTRQISYVKIKQIGFGIFTIGGHEDAPGLLFAFLQYTFELFLIVDGPLEFQGHFLIQKPFEIFFAT